MQVPHGRVREEFTRQADTLASAGVFTDETALARFREAVGATRTSRVLDLACGPGIVTAAIAPEAAEVIACDLTAAMLVRARSRCREADLRNVRCVLALAESLPFRDAAFDVVVTRASFHHFVEPALVVAEMVRVTRPGGRLVIGDVLSSDDTTAASLHNALEILRDPSHHRMLPAHQLLNLLDTAGSELESSVGWTTPREFEEWLRITNAPERIEPLRVVMTALAEARLRAGINLDVQDGRLSFEHRWLLAVARRR